MAEKQHKTELFELYTQKIREFLEEYIHIDCQPVGQRLPVSSQNNSKEAGIIQSIFDGESIGMITLMIIDSKANRKQRRDFMRTFEKESVDGGHRKRAIYAYYTGEFKVDGKYYNDLSKEEQEKFLEFPLSFTCYTSMDNDRKGRIFRNLNKTTDVNFIEMLNSYGDITIANYVREKVRFVDQINNAYHDLFDFHFTPSGEVVYEYLSFDNDRLKQDHLFARIVHRYVKFPNQLLGGSSDDQLETMYKEEDLNIDPKTNTKIDRHLDFLRMMAQMSKNYNKRGLTLHDFKILSALHLYLVDTYKVFNVKDALNLFKTYSTADVELKKGTDKNGKYSKDVHKASGYAVNLMYTRYINAPQHETKTAEAFSYLLREMGDVEKFLDIKDPVKSFSFSQRQAKLAEQGYVCAIDGKDLTMEEAHAAHIVAHSKGGKTVYSNLAMVRACYNIDMGTMNLNEYKETLPKAA